MKKLSFIMVLVLIIVSVGLISSCSIYKDQKVNLYSGMQPAKIHVSVTDYSPEFVELKILVDESSKLQNKWLYHIIEDEQKNIISEGWYSTTIGNAAYKIRIKTKEGFFFEHGKEYALCIGLQNPEETLLRTNKYKCEIYHKFTLPTQKNKTQKKRLVYLVDNK